MSRNGNESGNNSAYILDSDTTIRWDGECLDVKRRAESWDEQGCLIPLFLLVVLFESAFMLFFAKVLEIALAGELKLIIPILFFGISNIPGLAVLLIVQSLIFPYHCVLDFHGGRYKLSNGLLRISVHIPSDEANLILNLLYSRGDWGFGLKIPMRIQGLTVTLPVIPGRIIGSKTRTYHEIRRLQEWLHTIPPIDISMPQKTGKWSMPRPFAIFMGMVFLLGGLLVLFGRNHQEIASVPEQPLAAPRSTIDMKPVVHGKMGKVFNCPSYVKESIATVIGSNPSAADRYEARNDALRSIARERHLPTNDVTALVHWLASTNDVLRVERLAALKNDVMNLLRSQEPPPANLVDTLISMFEDGEHPPAVLDYCIQHLGAMQGDVTDDATRRRIREVLVGAARRAGQPH